MTTVSTLPDVVTFYHDRQLHWITAHFKLFDEYVRTAIDLDADEFVAIEYSITHCLNYSNNHRFLELLDHAVATCVRRLGATKWLFWRDLEVRKRAIHGLGLLQARAAIATLVDILFLEPGVLCDDVWRAISDIGISRIGSMDKLITALTCSTTTPFPVDNDEAVAVLAAFPDLSSELLSEIQHRSRVGLVRIRAGYLLDRLRRLHPNTGHPSSDAMWQMLSRLDSSNEYYEMQVTLSSLRRRHIPAQYVCSCISSVSRLLTGPSHVLRREAVVTLQHVLTLNIVHFLAECLHDFYWEYPTPSNIRRGWDDLFVSYKSTDPFWSRVGDAASDDDWRVQLEVVQLLGSLSGVEAETLLATLRAHPNHYVHEAAERAQELRVQHASQTEDEMWQFSCHLEDWDLGLQTMYRDSGCLFDVAVEAGSGLAQAYADTDETLRCVQQFVDHFESHTGQRCSARSVSVLDLIRYDFDSVKEHMCDRSVLERRYRSLLCFFVWASRFHTSNTTS